MKTLKKLMSILLAVMMLALPFSALAEDAAATESTEQSAPAEGQQPPEMPEGGQPPEMPDGQQPPEMPQGGMPGGDGQQPPEMPNGGMPGGMGGPGGGTGPSGGSSQPESYSAVQTYAEDAEVTEDVTSTGTDENAVHVEGGSVKLESITLTRVSDDSTGGDSASFYGVGAAALVTGGTLTVANATIDTDANGGAGVFAYGDGVAYVSDTTISTKQGASGGIHVAGGGTLYASNLTVTTEGGSSAAIRSDRGSGTMVVDGGTYTANGSGSPAVYVTADISIKDAELTATGSEALCLEGLNSVRLYNCSLTGDMSDQEQNDNTWTVILYQSMSGDSQVGQGSFEMDGGTLTSKNGGLFYTTNTESVFTIRNVDVQIDEEGGYFLRCTGNANQRGWGSTGANGADCVFTALQQELNGDIIWDSISNLTLYVAEGSVLTGAVIDDESCAGEGGDGSCALVIDATSTWVVTGDSAVTSLSCAGAITDAEGNAVTIAGSDGTVYVEGTSQYTVTVESFSTEADTSAMGSISAWEEHAEA